MAAASVPQNLDSVYVDVISTLFCSSRRACDFIIDANPLVLIIRDLSILMNLVSFRHFYANPRLEQVVLFAWTMCSSQPGKLIASGPHQTSSLSAKGQQLARLKAYHPRAQR